MKIQIFVRSADWLKTAGTRIRYQRLKRELDVLGWTMAIDPIAAIQDGLRLNADVYLFSKCQDAGALMLAHTLREAGALVGFDLFDDYFSGFESMAFGRRTFQRSLVGEVDFLLCSTQRIAGIVEGHVPGTPIHVMNDPHDLVSKHDLRSSLAARLARARDNRRVDMVWFGHGNNPVFPVGLDDTIGFGAELDLLRNEGWGVRLDVLSNVDALDGALLNRLQALPMEVTVETWSEAREMAALDQALVAFLPVNFQSFSIAKSLNRAVSALARGAQVLSPGFPLYDALDPFIYRSVRDLADDLASNPLKLSYGNVDELISLFDQLADPAREARDLVMFLDGLTSPCAVPVDERVYRGIIHGSSSPPAIDRLCKSLGWLSLGSPFSGRHQQFHATMGEFGAGGSFSARVSREGYIRLADEWRENARPLVGSFDGYTHEVPLPDTAAGQTLASVVPEMVNTRAVRILTFRPLMSAAAEVYQQFFPATHLLCSEQETPLTQVAGSWGSCQ